MLRGLYVSFGQSLDIEANTRLQALGAALLQNPLPGVTDLVPSYTQLYLEYNARQTSAAAVRAWASRQASHSSRPTPRRVEIPVRYDGPDLSFVAQQTGLSVEEVIARHAATYHVFAVGFTPGYPFMGVLDPALQLPRRATPRLQVAAHSIGIAGRQTGIYPLPSPGGWHLLGTVLQAVYDPHRPQPFLLQAGDSVRLRPASGATPASLQTLELLPSEPRFALFRVEEPGCLDLPMDTGRCMAGRYGLAASGPLDGRSAALSNALVGNGRQAVLLEFNLWGPVLSVLQAAVVAFAGYGMRPELDGEALTPNRSFAVKPGQTLRFRPHGNGARGYLAVAGGLESAQFYGSASTDLKGGIGRALRAGDVLGVAGPQAVRPGYSFGLPALPSLPTVRIYPGPQATPEALQALTAAPFTLSQADRMGVRLEGQSVPGGELISEATPLGAIQVTVGGQPIVLLNDRGRIGGYAKPALVHPADLPLLAQLRSGSRVRFRLV